MRFHRLLLSIILVLVIGFGWSAKAIGKYLTVDEQATYIDVTMDGIIARIHSDGSDEYIGEILDPNNLSTAWMRFGSKVDVGGTVYAISEDTGIAVTLQESTSIRVVIKVAGDFEDSSQSSLANESGSELWLYIYPDRIVQHLKFNATGSITLADSTDNGQCFMDSVVANIANEDSKYESSGTETDAGSDGEQNSADYIATLSDEINIIGVNVDESLGGGTATFGQYIDDPGVSLAFEWNDGTITAASIMTVAWHIDSADRENDGGTFLDWDTDIDTNSVTVGTICEQSADGLRYYAHTAHTAGAGNEPPDTDYWHEYRMTLGDQYKDIVMAAPTTGDEVLDMVIPKNLPGVQVVKTGSDIEVQDDSQNYSAAHTVPTDANLAVLLVSGYAGTDLMFDGATVTLGGDAMLEGAIAENGNDENASAIFYLINPKTGSQTLACNWLQDPATGGREGVNICLIFYKNVDPLNPILDSGIETGGDNTTINITGLETGDGSMTVGVTYSFDNDPVVTDDSQTEIWVSAAPIPANGADIGVAEKAESTSWQASSGSSMVGAAISIAGISSIASDGARHLEMDSGELVFTNDITRINQAIVVRDPAITVDGGSDLVVGRWKMDDTDADTTLDDESASNNDGTLSGGNTLDNLTNADAVQGTAILLDGTDDYLDFSAGIDDLTDDDKFTIIMKFKPNFNHDVGSDQPLLSVGSSDTDKLYINYEYSAGNDFTLYNDINNQGSDEGGVSDAYTTNEALQQWHTLTLAVDLSNNYVHVKFDSTETHFVISDAWQATVDFFNVGTDDESAENNGAYYIDKVKLINGAMILDSGPFVDMHNSYALPHGDVLFYWSGSDCTGTNVEIGALQGTKGGSGGSFSATGGIYNDDYFDTEGTASLYFSVTPTQYAPKKGLFSAWVQVKTIADGDFIFGIGDANDYITGVMDASGNLDVTYFSQDTAETITGDIVLTADTWKHIWVGYDDAGNVSCEIDGVVNGDSPITIANTWGGETSDVLYLGADYAGANFADIWIQHLTITDKKGTPGWPAILGSGQIDLSTLSM